ncbi:sensor histidine kinase [Hymenobacter saemangeumensis]
MPAPRRLSFALLQCAAWLLAYGLVVAYLGQRINDLLYVCSFTLVAFASYAATIYGYVYGLSPWLYHRLPRWAFVLAVLAFLGLVGLGRFYLEAYVVRPHFPSAHNTFLNGNRGHLGYLSVTICFAFGFGLLAQAALRSVALQQQKDELENKQLQAEMNLLKAQVQPHFLFNTLNNIYYEAYLEAPRTADLIEKLATLMRYFMELSRLERVPLQAEIAFLRNYIALEKIRFRHELSISLEVEADEQLPVPPMLLIPLVENLFKHGFDKRQRHNAAHLHLRQAGGWLTFEVSNSLPEALAAPSAGGFGLRNLRERLKLLYGGRFELTAGAEGQQFVARLTLPAQP